MEEKIWIKKSEIDFRAAKNSFTSKDYPASTFWSQQCAEKAIKAVIILEKNKLFKIHDLSTLGRLAKMPINLLPKAALLNPYYTSSRYPLAGITEKVTEEESKKALSFAEEILKWAKQKIKT